MYFVVSVGHADGDFVERFSIEPNLEARYRKGERILMSQFGSFRLRPQIPDMTCKISTIYCSVAYR